MIRGLPVILLPGLNGDGRLFAPLMQLMPDAKVITYPPDSSLGYDALTALAAAALPEGRCVLVCESFSGPIGVRLAARMPERIAGLVFATSFIMPPRPRWTLAIAARMPYGLVPKEVSGIFMLPFNAPVDVRNAYNEVAAVLPPDLIRARIEIIRACDERETFRKTKCPVLVLSGGYDIMVPRAAAELIRKLRPDARIVTLKARHLLLQTRASEAHREINAFVAAL